MMAGVKKYQLSLNFTSLLSCYGHVMSSPYKLSLPRLQGSKDRMQDPQKDSMVHPPCTDDNTQADCGRQTQTGIYEAEVQAAKGRNAKPVKIRAESASKELQPAEYMAQGTRRLLARQPPDLADLLTYAALSFAHSSLAP